MLMVSLPAPATIVSLPRRPLIQSASGVPARKSFPLVPKI
jgi:hypothetical protein